MGNILDTLTVQKIDEGLINHEALILKGPVDLNMNIVRLYYDNRDTIHNPQGPVDITQGIVERLGRDNISNISGITIRHNFLVVDFTQSGKTRQLAILLSDPSRTYDSLQFGMSEILQEAQDVVVDMEKHIDAMKAIFAANWVHADSFIGRNITREADLNDRDVFTREMAESEDDPLIEKTLRQVQEIARQKYRDLIGFMADFPVASLPENMQTMIRAQIDSYNRMVLGIGREYNGGAKYFKQKTEEEVLFGLTYMVQSCTSVEELFDYYKSMFGDMSDNIAYANSFTKQVAYPYVQSKLNELSYIKLKELTAGKDSIEPYGDVAQVYALFVYYLRGGAGAGLSTIGKALNHPTTETIASLFPATSISAQYLYGLRDGKSWDINDDFQLEPELRDTTFANQVIHEYLTKRGVLEKLQTTQEITFDIVDPEADGKALWQISSELGEALSHTSLSREELDDFHDAILASISLEDDAGKFYKDLTIEQKLQATVAIRITRYLRHHKYQLETHNDLGWYHTEHHANGGKPPALDLVSLVYIYHQTILPQSVKVFGSFIGENFGGNKRLQAQDIDILSPGEQNLIGLFCDINGYGGIFQFSDTTNSGIQMGSEIAMMIAVTVGLTIATGGIASAAGATRFAALYYKYPALQGAFAGLYSVPAGRMIHNDGHDSLEEFLVDIGSDISVGLIAGILGGAAAGRIWKQGHHVRNTTLNATDIVLLGLLAEIKRQQETYNYLHGERFLWDDTNIDEDNIGEDDVGPELIASNHSSP